MRGRGRAADEAATRVYKGSTLGDLLPQIRAEMGDDAIIVSQRDGVRRGVRGLLGHEFVELEVRRPTPLAAEAAELELAARIRAYGPDRDRTAPSAALVPAVSGEPAVEEEGLEPDPGEPEAAEPEAAEPLLVEPLAPPLEPAGSAPSPAPLEAKSAEPERDGETAEPELEAKSAEPEAQPEPEPEPLPLVSEAPGEPLLEPPPPAPGTAARRTPPVDAAGIVELLVSRGLSFELAEDLVAEAVSHVLPFVQPPQLAGAVRVALARRFQTRVVTGSAGRAVAFVGACGAGKSRAAAGLATAYAAASDLPVRTFTLETTDDADIAGARAEGVAVLDTPGVVTRDRGAVSELAARLDTLPLDDIHLVVPATLSVPAARELLANLSPLRPTSLVLSHADECDYVGGLLEVALGSGLPLAYLAAGPDARSGLRALEPRAVAELVLP
jgi:flagellar biosynthesis GTPase FlhF